MFELDGSRYSGSGTIVRDAIPFSILVGEELHLINIRAKREKPGLRAQHLKGVEAAGQLCNGRIEGAALGSREIRFKPGKVIQGGTFHWDIGTAGSTTMLAVSLLPVALFADAPSNYLISGGLFQDYAPSAFHLQQVLFPMLRKMGAHLELHIIQPGYVPEGKGEIELSITPLKEKLKSITATTQGNITGIRGVALSSLLDQRKVSERMAEECQRILKTRGYNASIDILNDSKENPCFKKTAVQAGASLAIWAETDTGCLLGSDMAGALGRTSEFIGRKVANNLLADIASGATVDRHLADQLIPFCALAEGESSYVIPRMNDHIEARLWLAEEILGARTSVYNNTLTIKGIGYKKEVRNYERGTTTR